MKKIIIAALEVFSKDGYEKSSINMIVKKADVPRRVLYYYFKNKEELFEFLIYYFQEHFIGEIEKNIILTERD